jgi:hypothetical protein
MLRTLTKSCRIVCGILLACMLSFETANAQTTIENPYARVSADDAAFTPDVAVNLTGVTRVRVELAFKGDIWRVRNARQESGVPPSYADRMGFVRVEIADAGGEVLSSIGVPDPRVLRIYELVPDALTWTSEEPPRILDLQRRERPEMRARWAPSGSRQQGTLMTQDVPTSGPLITDPAVPRDLPVRPDLPTMAIEHASQSFRPDIAQSEQEMKKLAGISVLQLRGRIEKHVGTKLRPIVTLPPHIEAMVDEGQVVLFLPNLAKGCSVRVFIAASTSGVPTTLTVPLQDPEGEPRCRPLQ